MAVSQLFVKSGVTLTIPAGTSIYALPAADGGVAPAIVIEQGGKIAATGTAAAPITMTTVLAESALASTTTVTTDTSSASGSLALGETGKWGGLIILGRAPTSAASYASNYIEGITGKPYGGTDPTDSSGLLRYVRVWHGGAVVGADNEINGVTFGGVGSGTVVDHCEVAYNADDGFE